jgi:hypothetical protein
MKLYRPVNNAERDLIQASNWLSFPPRLTGQPIFYPVLNEAYATEITKDWNVPSYGEGHVVAFEINDDFISTYKVEQVGLDHHLEYWIPAEDLIKFNNAIIGKIELVASYK